MLGTSHRVQRLSAKDPSKRYQERLACHRSLMMSFLFLGMIALGPGPGNQLPRFTPSAVSKIYGLEPIVYFTGILEARVEEYSGLVGKYEVLNTGLGDQKLLDLSGLKVKSVDTIIRTQALCSISDPSAAAKQIYKLLKPGGQLVFWEHQRSEDTITRSVQKIWGYV